MPIEGRLRGRERQVDDGMAGQVTRASLSLSFDRATPRLSDGEAHPASPRLAELYVALKSKPIAVLYGPAHSGKLGAAREMARRLAGAGPDRIQEMIGHPWWASGVERAAVFTAAQERFNRSKLQALIVEAARDPAAGGVYVALLSRISPAEWNDLAALASQFQRGYTLGDLDDHPLQPLPVSPRIRLIATADALPPAPWKTPLLRKASLMPWTAHRGPREISPTPGQWPVVEERSFPQCAIRTPRSALRKLRGLPEWRDEMLKPLLAFASVMNLQGVPDVNQAASEALVYLANAWTQDGEGLLAPDFDANLRLAVRLAVRLAMVPRLAGQRTLGQPKADGGGRPATTPSRPPSQETAS